jgi:acyl carrier protein
MHEEAVWNTLVRVIRETFDDPDLEVARDTTAADVANWDSISNVELIVALEAEFGIRFRTGEIASLRNAGDLADILVSRTRERGFRSRSSA